MANAEEESVLVVGVLHFFRFSGREQLLQLLEGLARDENALLTADAFEDFIRLFDVGKPVAVGGYHGQ